jgi:hypothetical protein
MKKKLFIDVDGVLFGTYAGVYQPRPFIGTFLFWAQRYFDCFFLTGWDEESLRKFLNLSYIHAEKIEYAQWTGFKTEAIEKLAPDGDFFWIDDEPERQDADFLDKKGWTNNLVSVNMDGENGLVHVVQKLSGLNKVEPPDWTKKCPKEN